MNRKDKLNALEIITAAQQSCAPVTVKIGSVNQQSQIVNHESIRLIHCPASVTGALVDNGYSLSMCNGELDVEKY